MKTIQRLVLILMFFVFESAFFCQMTNTSESFETKNSKIYLGVGTTTLNTESKNLNYGNAIIFDLGFYQSLWKKNKTAFGIHASGNYLFGNGKQNNYEIFPISGATSNTQNSTTPKLSGYGFGAGPQIEFYLSKQFSIAPIIDFSYLSSTLEAVTVTQTSIFNGQNINIPIYSQPEIKNSGFGIIPRLRLEYLITKNIGIWFEGNYAVLPKKDVITTTFQPSGNPDQNGEYNIESITQGSTIESQIISNNSGFGFGGGITFAFGNPNKEEQKPLINDSQNSSISDNTKKNKNCKTYTAPKIINNYPFDQQNLDKGNLNIRFDPSNNLNANYKVFVWEVKDGKRKKIKEEAFPNGFKGVILGLNPDKKNGSKYEVQLQAIEGKIKNPKNNRAVIQSSSCSTFENEGFSNITTYNVSNSGTTCAAYYEFFIDKTECVKDKKVKVYCHVVFQNLGNITTPNPTLSNVTFVDHNTGLPIIASNFSTSLSPLSLLPTGTSIPFTFELEGDICDKDLRITYDINWECPTGPQHITACQDVVKLPCCYCSYCDNPQNMDIQNVSQSTNLLGGDNLNIIQNFTINPKNISKVEAELVYMQEDEMDAACKVCRANENEVYNFISNNTMIWNSGQITNASAGNYSQNFPTKILNWTCNKKGNLQLNMTVALPGTAALSCCERHGTVCIKYKFTDIECKTCEILVCYNY